MDRKLSLPRPELKAVFSWLDGTAAPRRPLRFAPIVTFLARATVAVAVQVLEGSLGCRRRHSRASSNWITSPCKSDRLGF
jgi:hypothetical protein